MANILVAIGIVFTFTNLMFSFIGVVLGIVIGALPGLTSTMGVALFIPVTFAMDPATGLVFLASIYMASTYGGSISAILIGTPGTPAAIITAIDGYEMTKQGRGGQAIGMATFASFVGGIVSCFALLLIAPPLSRLVLKFGPSEMFFLAVFGLTVIVSLSKGSMVKGLMVGIVGVLFSTMGIDALTGAYRFTFDKMELFGGLPIIATVIGVYSASQVFNLAAQKRGTIQYELMETTDSTIVKWVDIKKNMFNMVRSGIIGTIVGIVPGAGMSIASALSYNAAKSSSQHPEEFGEGSIEGVAASEGANNGVVGGSLIPLLTLGIPGNTVSAIFLGGLIIHGLRPGAQLFTKYADITYSLIIGLFVATFIMLIVGTFGAKYFAKIAIVPTNMLAPVIMGLCVIGSYAVRNNFFDVKLMLVFGIVGFVMHRLKFFQAPFVLGLILGPMAEEELRRALMLSKGSYSALLARPLSMVLFVLILLSLAYPFIQDYLARKKVKNAESGTMAS